MASPTTKTIHQIVSPDGKACKAVGTENVWVGYGDPTQEFGVPTGNNEVTPLSTGKLYYAELIKEFNNAQQEIYIAGWQVNWDAQLDAAGTRLFDVLLKAARRDVKIYVMPWNDPGAGVETYDRSTKAALEHINKLTGKDNVIVQLAGSHPDEAESFFSHHQKQVVIDRKISFVGGLDVAYGRLDDEHFKLQANADGREALNRYNGCIALTGKLADKQTVEAAWLEGGWDKNVRIPFTEVKTNAQIVIDKMAAGARWQTPAAGLTTIDPGTQPRMPWQDVHCKIVGPATDDLVRNFVLRWNSARPKTRLALPTKKKYPIENKCLVQVLRSAPYRMRIKEHAVLDNAERRQMSQPLRAQDDILRAMNTLIQKAQHFIYIESQFFVSGFKNEAKNEAQPTRPAQQVIDAGGGAGRAATRVWELEWKNRGNEPPSNTLLKTLGDRIDQVIRDCVGQPFHVYITLPVHPEGKLNEGAIVGQVYWTMQSLVFGSQSLLNRIRRSLKAKQIFDKDPKANWSKVYLDGDQSYKDIPLEKCFEYVTLLNLRNWAKLGSGPKERYVTEQVYIHSKLMIVDDRYAIVGSANVNDRSLLGTRDSELAVLVVDTDSKQRDLKSNGKQVPVRAFARELRKQVWRKIFGITAGGDKAANELANAVLYPAAPASWKAIQKRAKQNTELYEAAFDWIPRNRNAYTQTDQEGNEIFASIWPIWDSSEQSSRKAKKGFMPFEADFWKAPRHNPAATKLEEVKGFITFLPIHWTRNEDNKIPYHNSLLTKIELQGTPSSTTIAQNTTSESSPDLEKASHS